MSAAMRKKAKDLIKLGLDDRGNDNERMRSLVQAAQIITKYKLLDSPLDGILDSDNETVKAASTIFEGLTNPDFVGAVKKVAGGLRSDRRRRRDDD